ncbi:MAG TPA: YCF48-related protein [Blastocatellia bacterium]|nr:YCF48-related protein [Blastocatellia bacterium]
MLNTRLAFVSVLTAMLLVAACSSSKTPGKWTAFNFYTNPDAQINVFSINFVNDSVGWINGYRAPNPSPAGNANANANVSAGKKARPKNANEQADQTNETNGGFVVLETKDGGENWRPVPDMVKNRIRSVWFIAPQRGWAVTLDHDILNTTDGGQTWTMQRKAELVNTQIAEGKFMDMPEQIEQVRFLDDQHGYAWGGGQKMEIEKQGGVKVIAHEYPGIFLMTFDGGANWKKANPYPFDGHIEKTFFLDLLHAWAHTQDNFYATTDGGLNWTKVETKLPQPVLDSIFFIDEKTGWVVTDGRIAKTADGGQTWRKIWEIKDVFKMRDIAFTDASHGWAVGDNGVILYTTDGETKWTVVSSPVTAKLTRLTFVGNRGWAVGQGGVGLRYEAE